MCPCPLLIQYMPPACRPNPAKAMVSGPQGAPQVRKYGSRGAVASATLPRYQIHKPLGPDWSWAILSPTPVWPGQGQAILSPAPTPHSWIAARLL